MLYMNIDPIEKTTANLKRRWFNEDSDYECEEENNQEIRHDLDVIKANVTTMQSQVDRAVQDVEKLMHMIIELEKLRQLKRQRTAM
ncbi:hypothetical protein THRCLA_22188 [Thraustotheca clavata]|uniref:Uncharacterized protein n=1 Tax=Thraustotheca clavata TaxID=74557 RepID=A0A1V9ZAM5_9STRA|nr:hypothetical protein THRCLA_22188 [Thraustotheca clavata]